MTASAKAEVGCPSARTNNRLCSLQVGNRVIFRWGLAPEIGGLRAAEKSHPRSVLHACRNSLMGGARPAECEQKGGAENRGRGGKKSSSPSIRYDVITSRPARDVSHCSHILASVNLTSGH